MASSTRKKNNAVLRRFVIRHPLTNLTLITRDLSGPLPSLFAVAWGIVAHYNGERLSPRNDPRLAPYAVHFRRFLDGEKDTLDFPVSLEGTTDFQEQVLHAARRIPWGWVATYGDLARLAGHPKAIRAVASVMSGNRLPLIIPCHRVVSSRGGIGGFQGATTGKPVALKRRLLENEIGDASSRKRREQ